MHIRRGVVLYICFLSNSPKLEQLPKAVDTVLDTHLRFAGATASIRELAQTGGGCDVLVVPQASLAGKQKNKQMQYHALIGKAVGLALYQEFVRLLEERAEELNAQPSNSSAREAENEGDEKKEKSEKEVEVDTIRMIVHHGVYGNQQRLRMDCSEGPNTHMFEFSA